MKIVLPVKMFYYDYYNKKYVACLIDKEYDITEEYKEIWFRDKPSGYKISNLGNVLKPDGGQGKIFYDKDGYTRFVLHIPKNHEVYQNSERINYPYKVHRAVAELFVENPNPTEYDIVMHKNDIRDCNYFINLLWGNEEMNMEDKVRSADIKFEPYKKEITDFTDLPIKEFNPNGIFAEKDVREICYCIYIKNITKPKDIINKLNKSDRDEIYLKSYKNLIKNIKDKTSWRHVIADFIEL